MLDLEKIMRVDRRQFWRIIKNNKRKSQKPSNQKMCFQKFSDYYKTLFENSIPDNEENGYLEHSVQTKKEELKNIIYKDSFTRENILNAIKKLKKNKSIGFDYVSNEMLINSKCDKLIQLLCGLYNLIVKFGLQISNLNTSVITPIPKKNNATDKPEDYRPISVSSCFAQLYETLLLDKIEDVFCFSPNQFGYRKLYIMQTRFVRFE